MGPNWDFLIISYAINQLDFGGSDLLLRKYIIVKKIPSM